MAGLLRRRAPREGDPQDERAPAPVDEELQAFPELAAAIKSNRASFDTYVRAASWQTNRSTVTQRAAVCMPDGGRRCSLATRSAHHLLTGARKLSRRSQTPGVEDDISGPERVLVVESS